MWLSCAEPECRGWSETAWCPGPGQSRWEIASLTTLAPLPVTESKKSMTAAAKLG